MTRTIVLSALCALLIAPLLPAQTTPSSTDMATPLGVPLSPHPGNVIPYQNPQRGPGIAPFSHIAIGGGVSAMGVNLQAAVNVSRHFNVRGAGNFFNYTDSNISVSGFTAAAKLNFDAAGATVDYYPFANHGLRVSGGALFRNNNALSATLTAAGGSSFKLNGVTYYSSPSSPVQGVGSLGLNAQKPAPTATIGWGNMIPRRGGHLSFPVEIGAAYIGQPALNLALTSGQVCANAQGTAGCQSVTSDASLNSNLQAQIAKDENDLKPLRFYPIVSFGLAYSFRIR